MTFKLIQKVRKTIARYHMLKQGDTVLVGVSAGPDSVCLLYLLKELRQEYSLSLHIAHLHHGFRGSEADEDVRFVRAIGESLGIPVHVEHADIPAYLKKTGLSKQAGARKVRYEFFSKAAEATGACRIAVGHTADDQVETFLMRLLKGAGPHGLSGIPPVRDKIIRPLIELTREEVMGFLSERGIRYRIDSSNLSKVYLRNKIRLDLIPYLAKEYNPNIMSTLMRNLTILRDEDTFLDEYIQRLYPDVVISRTAESITLDAVRLASLAHPVQRRILRHAVESIAGEEAVALSFRHIEDSLALLEKDKTGEVHLPHDLRIRREGETLGVYLRPPTVHTSPYTYDIAIPGDTPIPEAGMTISAVILDGPSYDKGDKGVEGKEPYRVCFDMDKFSLPLVVRSRRPGDHFCPRGMGGKRKKIKEYFIDLKVLRKDREIIPVLASAEGILWIIGHRTDERFKVTPAAEKILQVTAFKNAA